MHVTGVDINPRPFGWLRPTSPPTTSPTGSDYIADIADLSDTDAFALGPFSTYFVQPTITFAFGNREPFSETPLPL